MASASGGPIQIEVDGRNVDVRTTIVDLHGQAQMRGLEKGDRVRFTFIQEDEGPRIETIGRAGQ